MPCKGLNVRAGKGHKAACFEKVEDRQAEEGCDDADVASPVKTIAELDASIAVVLVGGSKCLEDSQFDAASISVL